MKLNESYKREEFINFLKHDFLPSFSEDVRTINNHSATHTIKDAYYLGECTEFDIQVFELKTSGKSDKKISQAVDSFKLLKEYQSYKALVAYYSEDDLNWRFALLQMTPDITDKGKVVNNLSNPRRFSFLLGPDARVKTPERYLKEKVKDFSDLLDRFNVEVVTKEFFDNYKKLFEKLLKHFENDNAFKIFASKNSIKLEVFTKKILGQIVFIYFLQKKGWLGAPKGEHISKGDKTFLRSLFIKCKEGNQSFFNEYLEYLFYDCLNKKPEMAGSFYRGRFECQIPFLNGGLFEPINNYNWQNEFVHIPNEIFSNNENSGILDIFDLYNFTIDENTPDDQEVSVDPEMLGKVFENLIEDNIRKGQGAFYTPREIVQYMCQESLINFLNSSTQVKDARPLLEFFDLDKPRQLGVSVEIANEIDVALKNIKVVDPACGSGAFLIGMLQLIVQIRSMMCVITNKKTSEYKLKKQTIENCIYGVDIDPGAVDIAKLRFWLSIVVDEDIDEIEPLPNLDYKIMQGNSLLENLVVGDSQIIFNFEGNKKIDRRTKEMKNLFEVQTQTKLFFDKSETLAEQLEKLHTEFFNEFDSDKKKMLKRRIDGIEDELIQSKCQEEIDILESQVKNSINGNKNLTKNTLKILAIREILNKWKKDRLRPFFPWKLHFGEVFNRENSGFDIVIANPPYEEVSSPTDKKMFQNIYVDVLSGHYDLYIFFFKKAFDISRVKGTICFITPHTYLHYTQYKNLRNFIYNNNHINEITGRISGVFDTAIVDNSIIIMQVGENNDSTMFSQKEISDQKLINTNTISLDRDEFSSESFDIDSIKNIAILKKYLVNCELLGEITESSQGITVFAKVQGEKKNYFRDSKVNEFCQPFIKGRNINKYSLAWPNTFIEYGKWLWCSRDRKFFDNEKLFFRQTADRPIGTYIKDPMYCIDSVHSIIQKDKNYDLKYILAILNSRFGNYLYNLLITETGKVFAQVKLTFLRGIPIKNIEQEGQKEFVDLVDKILNITEKHDYVNNIEEQSLVRNYEKQIDLMVYKLYNLTPEEIVIVNSSIQQGTYE